MPRNDYEARKAERIERYRERAEKADRQSTLEFEHAHKMQEGIPPGQPILIGHHSEKRHRAHLKRVDGAYRRGSEEYEKAKHYRGKAAGAENNDAISSDDPKAPERLRHRIASLEDQRERMRKANAAIRKHKRAGVEAQTAAVRELGYSPENAYSLTHPHGEWRGQGHEKWELSNLGANIRRLKKRLESLEAAEGIETTRETIGDVEIVQSAEENRTQIFFPGKPSEEIRTMCKRDGFRWARSVGAWQRMLSNGALHWAREIAKAHTEEV